MEVCHLYEVVISNSRMWLKVLRVRRLNNRRHSSSLVSTERATSWTDTALSSLSSSPNAPITLLIGCQLWTGFQRDGTTTNSTLWGLPIHGVKPCRTPATATERKGRLDAAYCSDFGLHDETDKRASKSENFRHRHYVQSMKERIARLDESRRANKRQGERRSPPRGAVLVPAKPGEGGGDLGMCPAVADRWHLLNEVAALIWPVVQIG